MPFGEFGEEEGVSFFFCGFVVFCVWVEVGEHDRDNSAAEDFREFFREFV